jgi:virginiamycin B lyase
VHHSPSQIWINTCKKKDWALRKHLVYLCALLSLLLLFSGCNENKNQNPQPTPTRIAKDPFQEYPLPRENGGLMRPALDSKGRVWFGAMGHNALTMFDPQTRKFSQFSPPGGKYGIMGVIAAPDDTIWFTEQYANYIGHYNLQTKKFNTYPLPEIEIPDPSNAEKKLQLTSAPNDLALDANGDVWFTEMNADKIGMLDVKTGKFKHYQIGEQETVQTLSPYGITIDAQGTIWFTKASSNELGRLDALTGVVNLFTVKNLDSALMEVTSDTKGNIWATTFKTPHLISFDPQSEVFASYIVSKDNKMSGGIYDLAITKDGTIWLTATGANQIASLDVVKKHFTYYDIPTAASTPFGISIASDGVVWFTEPGGNSLGSLVP